MERAAVSEHMRRFRFPDGAWWNERSAHRPIPQYRIDRRPDDAAEYGTDTETIVKRVVERIVGRFDPISVWLFGSMARGNVRKYSDIDLMVMMPDGTDCGTATRDMMLEVAGSMLPYDIIVNTPEQWDGRIDDVGSVQHSISRYGVMLYG